jgi:hypothetical protein
LFDKLFLGARRVTLSYHPAGKFLLAADVTTAVSAVAILSFFFNFVLNFVPSQVLPTVVRTLRIDFVDGSPDSLQAAM